MNYGIGPSKACSILGAIELGKRIAASMPKERSTITGSEDVAKLFMEETSKNSITFTPSIPLLPYLHTCHHQ